MRSRRGRARRARSESGEEIPAVVRQRIDDLKAELAALDERIAPLARASAGLANVNWGPLMRAGNDDSYLAHLVERHADIYTSRVSNFLFATPFRFFRSPRGSLPHDVPATCSGQREPGK